MLRALLLFALVTGVRLNAAVQATTTAQQLFLAPIGLRNGNSHSCYANALVQTLMPLFTTPEIAIVLRQQVQLLKDPILHEFGQVLLLVHEEQLKQALAITVAGTEKATVVSTATANIFTLLDAELKARGEVNMQEDLGVLLLRLLADAETHLPQLYAHLVLTICPENVYYNPSALTPDLQLLSEVDLQPILETMHGASQLGVPNSIVDEPSACVRQSLTIVRVLMPPPIPHQEAAADVAFELAPDGIFRPGGDRAHWSVRTSSGDLRKTIVRVENRLRTTGLPGQSPAALFIALNPPDGAANGPQVTPYAVRLPRKIRLESHDGAEYEFVSIAQRRGGTSSSGHYTAFVCPEGASARSCYDINDAEVQEKTIDVATHIVKHNARLVVYRLHRAVHAAEMAVKAPSAASMQVLQSVQHAETSAQTARDVAEQARRVSDEATIAAQNAAKTLKSSHPAGAKPNDHASSHCQSQSGDSTADGLLLCEFTVKKTSRSAPSVQLQVQPLEGTDFTVDGIRDQIGIGQIPGEYAGQLLGVNPHGFGTFFYGKDIVYRGQIKNGLRDGRGTMTGQESYAGEWSAGMQSGFGVGTTSVGSVFAGQWQNARPHGIGRLTRDTTLLIVGEFRDGEYA